MLQAMLSSVASVKAQQTKMNVIGNNLANVNTTAYKGARVTFADMLSQTVRGASRPTAARGGVNPLQYGLGVSVASADTNVEQGALNQTNRSTDLAIQGSGYFMTSNSQRVAYTRDGGFELDADGTLVQRATGERVLGWTADSFGVIDSTLPVAQADYLQVPLGQLNTVQQTTNSQWAGNLDANAVPTDQVLSQVRVYDSLGNPHDLTLRMYNHQVPASGPGVPVGATASWDWQIYEGNPTTGTLLASNATAGNERLYFGSNGSRLTSLPVGTHNRATIAPTPPGAFATFTIDVEFANISQFSGTSQVNAISQNGFPPGALQNFSISQDGVITGIFTNGLTRPIAQIAMAAFSNAQGLERNGLNQFLQTDNSGFALVGTPRTGGRGVVSSGFLEQSNIDIGNEFTELIITQRGFQANTKVVTTVDEMLQDLINMKR
jgi:flagellar hook protein FlgE